MRLPRLAARVAAVLTLIAAGCLGTGDSSTDAEETNASATSALASGALAAAPLVTPALVSRTGQHPSGATLFSVIVGLEGSFELEGKLTKSEVLQQRARIRAAQDRIAASLGAKDGKPDNTATARIVQRYTTVPGIALELTDEALDVLALLPDVATIEPDSIVAGALAETTGPSLVDSRRANRSMHRITGKGQVVAVIDSGVDRDHPFLGTDRFITTACFSKQSWWGDDNETLCPNGAERQIGGAAGENCTGIAGCTHGTQMAGVIGGHLDANQNGLAEADEQTGVAPEVKFVSIQVNHVNNVPAQCAELDREAPCVEVASSSIVAALDHVELLHEDHNLVAANVSLGGGSYLNPCNDAFIFKWAVDDLRSNQIATIVASGNSADESGEFIGGIGFPACVSSTVSVGSTDDDDELASFSQTSSHLSLLAPGVGVLTSVSGTNFAEGTGTSTSAAHVTGVWALMREHRDTTGETDDVGMILTRLRLSGKPIEDTRIDETFTRIDAVRALGIPVVGITGPQFITTPNQGANPVVEFTLDRKNFFGPLAVTPTVKRVSDGGDATNDFTFVPESDPVLGNQLRVGIARKLHTHGDHVLHMNVQSDGVSVFGIDVPLYVQTARPTVTDFSPRSGPPTTLVTIDGTNFSSLTRVAFVGVPALQVPTTVVSSTQLKVRVPAGASSGIITVSNAGVSANGSGQFTVTSNVAVTQVNPAHAPVGTLISVSGANFGTGMTARFGSVSAPELTVINAGVLTVRIPPSATVGPLTIVKGATQVNVPFTVGFPSPTLSSFAPLTGHAGQILTINGSGFFGTPIVRFGSVAATIGSITSSRMTVTIPVGVPDAAKISVKTGGGIVLSSQTFHTDQ